MLINFVFLLIYIYIYIYILYIYYIYILHQVSSETAFFLMVENKQSLSLSYSFHASKIILIQDDLCFLKLKPTSWSKLKRWNLWTTDAHARTKEKLSAFDWRSWDFLDRNFSSNFSIANQKFCLLRLLVVFAFRPDWGLQNVTYFLNVISKNVTME